MIKRRQQYALRPASVQSRGQLADRATSIFLAAAQNIERLVRFLSQGQRAKVGRDDVVVFRCEENSCHCSTSSRRRDLFPHSFFNTHSLITSTTEYTCWGPALAMPQNRSQLAAGTPTLHRIPPLRLAFAFNALLGCFSAERECQRTTCIVRRGGCRGIAPVPILPAPAGG
jgi:hypothetical protein